MDNHQTLGPEVLLWEPVLCPEVFTFGEMAVFNTVHPNGNLGVCGMMNAYCASGSGAVL